MIMVLWKLKKFAPINSEISRALSELLQKYVDFIVFFFLGEYLK